MRTWVAAHRRASIIISVFAVLLVIGAIADATSKPKAKPAAASGPSSAPATTESPAASKAPAPGVQPTTPHVTASPSRKSAAPALAPSKTTCQPGPDLIVRYTVPGIPDSAQVLGGTDLGNCTPTVDELEKDSQAGAGYCTEAAWASDNPGYNADATPPAPLKHLLMAVGDGCGQ